jgi:hypothetical protein
MSAKVSAKVVERNARSVINAQSSVHLADLLVMVLDESKAVATQWLGASVIVPKATRRLVSLESVSVSVVRTLATKSCGVAHCVWK